MWNVAYLDGAWRYDATSDRGRADYWFNCFGVRGRLRGILGIQKWVERLTQLPFNMQQHEANNIKGGHV